MTVIIKNMNDICLVSLITAGASFVFTFLISMAKRDPRKPGDGSDHQNIDITVDI